VSKDDATCKRAARSSVVGRMTRNVAIAITIAAVPLLALATSGCALYTVRGYVWSCEDHRPVEDAIVHLSDGRADGVSRSAADGSYETSLPEAASDTYSRVTVAKVGYRTSRLDVDRPSADQNVCLEPDARGRALAVPAR
jgi:hypothetical protein